MRKIGSGFQSTEYSYFDHLFPEATTASGWPSSISEWGLATPVNDIKSWVTYATDENGIKSEKLAEANFTLLKKMDNLPTLESYTVNSFYYDGDDKVYYVQTGLLHYNYQSGCKSPLQSSSY